MASWRNPERSQSIKIRKTCFSNWLTNSKAWACSIYRVMLPKCCSFNTHPVCLFAIGLFSPTNHHYWKLQCLVSSVIFYITFLRIFCPAFFYVTNSSFSSLFSSSVKRKKNFFLLIEASTLPLQFNLFTDVFLCSLVLMHNSAIADDFLCLPRLLYRAWALWFLVSIANTWKSPQHQTLQMLTFISIISGKDFSSENLSFLQILRYIAQLETSIPL